jgi:hypothetical protein
MTAVGLRARWFGPDGLLRDGFRRKAFAGESLPLSALKRRSGHSGHTARRDLLGAVSTTR